MEQDYKYLCLFENAPVAMWEIDLSAIRDCLVRDPDVLSGDVAGAEEIFGYARSRAVNRKYLDLFGA
jgi:hypothetical protein